MSNTKRNALLLLAGAGVIILLLAMSLPTLHLFQGESFSLAQSPSGGTSAGASLEGSDLMIWVVRGFVAFALIFLPIYIIQSMMSKQGRRRLIFFIVLFAVMFYLADYLHNHPVENKDEEQVQAAIGAQQIDAGGGTPNQFLAEPPSWLTIAIIATASVITVLAIVAVILIVQRRRKVPPSALDRLAEAAQATVAAIKSGGDFKLSVIRCYQQMMQVVKEEKGLTREATMTAREFEDQLVRKGLPQEAIRTLTRLFEQVRYGSLPPNPRDEMLALECLTDIAKACGSSWSA
ncbi:MAG: DUF4129 domain-containing protein [Chloroflexota bacterium]